MTKRDKNFARIAEIKQRLRNLPTEVLKERLLTGYLTKEGAIAHRELIDEREGGSNSAEGVRSRDAI
jgi:hypothetical protein